MLSESRWITFQISHQTEPRILLVKCQALGATTASLKTIVSQPSLNIYAVMPTTAATSSWKNTTFAGWQLFHPICPGAKVQKLLLQKQRCSTPSAPFIGLLPCKLGSSEYTATDLFQCRIYRE